MPDGGGDSETPPGVLPSEVRKVARRLAQSDQHDWRTGVRSGPNATGVLAASLQTSPPEMRRVGVREILEVLPSPGHVGCPASMNTDASLVYSGNVLEIRK